MEYQFPSLDLLNMQKDVYVDDQAGLEAKAMKLDTVFRNWKLRAQVVSMKSSPVGSSFEILPEAGASIRNIKRMKPDIELAVATSIEIIPNEEGKETLTILMKPKQKPFFNLRSILSTKEFKQAKSPLSIAVGYDYRGKPMVVDIEELPHMLVAGTTGSGKTVFMDDIIMSLLYKATPEQLGLILIDPKEVDFKFYNGIPHLLAPVVYEEKQIFAMLDFVESEMMRRYEKLSKFDVKNITDYNKKNKKETLIQIVVIIDEYSELMMDHGAELEAMIDHIARVGRAAGIHLIIATQRPTADVLTSSIKFNLPCRASFTTVDSTESKVIMNQTGAQRLTGDGEMLFSFSSSSGIMHAQAPYVSEEEIHRVVEFLAKQSM